MRCFWFVVLLAIANADVYTNLAAFQTACTVAGAVNQLSLITTLDERFQGRCYTDQTYTYTSTFGGATQSLTSTCTSGTAFNEDLCYARVLHVFQVSANCVAGDTLAVSSLKGPGHWDVC